MLGDVISPTRSCIHAPTTNISIAQQHTSNSFSSQRFLGSLPAARVSTVRSSHSRSFSKHHLFTRLGKLARCVIPASIATMIFLLQRARLSANDNPLYVLGGIVELSHSASHSRHNSKAIGMLRRTEKAILQPCLIASTMYLRHIVLAFSLSGSSPL